jgi:hypothetical protein
MNLIRFRERTKDLHLPDGRLVKVTVNDANTTQHVEDGDHVHGTAKPPPIGIVVRRFQPPRIRQAFHYDEDINLWAPVPPRDGVATPESIQVRGDNPR